MASPWLVLAESVEGTSHRSRGIGCQDACRFGYFGESHEWLAVTVADGAGSASHSALGAALTCESLLSAIDRKGLACVETRGSLLEVVGEVRQLLSVEAERIGVAIRELATTMLLAVVGPEQSYFAQIGDGAIVINRGGDFVCPIPIEPGEYVNETEFITGEGYADALRYLSCDTAVIEFALITDGLQNLALDFLNRRPHQGFFQPFFEALRASTQADDLCAPLREFLDSPRVNERTDDDKTLTIAVRQI